MKESFPMTELYNHIQANVPLENFIDGNIQPRKQPGTQETKGSTKFKTMNYTHAADYTYRLQMVSK